MTTCGFKSRHPHYLIELSLQRLKNREPVALFFYGLYLHLSYGFYYIGKSKFVDEFGNEIHEKPDVVEVV